MRTQPRSFSTPFLLSARRGQKCGRSQLRKAFQLQRAAVVAPDFWGKQAGNHKRSWTAALASCNAGGFHQGAREAAPRLSGSPAAACEGPRGHARAAASRAPCRP